MFALKRLTTGRSIDRFRAFYLALVLLQLVTIGLYENDWLPGGVALLPGLITSLAGPFLSFLINLHNLRHRRTRTIDVTSALLSYLFTCISFAVLALIISDTDTGAFNVVLGTKRSGFETSLYFSIVTITTTGYGDIAPVSHLARGLACWEIMTGLLYQIFIFSIIASAIGTLSTERSPQQG